MQLPALQKREKGVNPPFFQLLIRHCERRKGRLWEQGWKPSWEENAFSRFHNIHLFPDISLHGVTFPVLSKRGVN